MSRCVRVLGEDRSETPERERAKLTQFPAPFPFHAAGASHSAAGWVEHQPPYSPRSCLIPHRRAQQREAML